MKLKHIIKYAFLAPIILITMSFSGIAMSMEEISCIKVETVDTSENLPGVYSKKMKDRRVTNICNATLEFHYCFPTDTRNTFGHIHKKTCNTKSQYYSHQFSIDPGKSRLVGGDGFGTLIYEINYAVCAQRTNIKSDKHGGYSCVPY